MMVVWKEAECCDRKSLMGAYLPEYKNPWNEYG